MASLKKDEGAIKKYEKIFDKISDLLVPGGQFIISDCSNYNFFPMLRLKNPFVPTIEWEIHHPPTFWYEIMERSGFTDPKISWLSPNRTHNIGEFFYFGFTFIIHPREGIAVTRCY